MYYDVSKRLDQIIKGGRMSMYEIADKASIPASTLYSYRYKGYFPPIDKLERICNVMGISLVEFFIDTETRGIAEEAIVSKWLCLTEEERTAIMEIIDIMINRKLFGSPRQERE